MSLIQAKISLFNAPLHYKVIRIKIFTSNLQNYKPEKNVVLCIIAYVITEDPFQVKQGFVGRK